MTRYKFLIPVLPLFMAGNSGADVYNNGVLHLTDQTGSGLYRHSFMDIEEKHGQNVYFDFSEAKEPDGSLDLRCTMHISGADGDVVRRIEYRECTLILDSPVRFYIIETVNGMTGNGKVKVVERGSKDAAKIQRKFDRMFRAHGGK